MAAYILAEVEISDPVLYEEYRREVPAVISAHGGRYLVRGGATQTLEGAVAHKRTVILEFEDMAHLQAFYHSPEYQRLVAIRQRAATSRLIAIEGY